MFEALLEQIARGLDARGIPYMLIGGQAVLLYGESRLTRDIDVTLGAGPDQLPLILEWIRACGWRALTATPEEFVARTLVLPCLDPASGIRMDLLFALSPYERQAIARARAVQVGQTPVRFASAEDLIIHKIIAGRPRDLEDVLSVALKNPQLDTGYIRKWLGELEKGREEPLATRFEEIWSRARPERP